MNTRFNARWAILAALLAAMLIAWKLLGQAGLVAGIVLIVVFLFMQMQSRPTDSAPPQPRPKPADIEVEASVEEVAVNIRPLLRDLRDKDTLVAASAAMQLGRLGRLGSPVAVRELLRAAHHHDIGLQNAAIQALGQIETDESYQGLLELAPRHGNAVAYAVAKSHHPLADAILNAYEQQGDIPQYIVREIRADRAEAMVNEYLRTLEEELGAE